MFVVLWLFFAAFSTLVACLPGVLGHGERFERLERRQDCTQVSVTFNINVTTLWGESVSLVGSIPELGSWDVSKAVSLSAVEYTTGRPVWSAAVNFPLGAAFEYKYVRFGTDGSLTWEVDPNRRYTTPVACNTSPIISTNWQFPPSIVSKGPSPATASASTTSAPAFCANKPDSRHCWADGFDINTDFDNHWPKTGRTVSYTFEIANATLAPDGYARPVFAINGQYPGPTIYADWGDTISVTVVNKLQNNGTAIHFHGLRQWHSNTQDGVPGLTECPLAPSQTKTYTFVATQYGTSWYHSHFSCQYGDGVLGPIVIHGPASANYDIDLGPLPITDWYHPTVVLQSARTQHINGPPPSADNGLINGSMTSYVGGSYSRTTLQPGKRHRLRLINTSVDNHFMVSLDGHHFQVISADFVPIRPYNTTWIFLGIGQRYDVIVTADQTPGSFWLRAEVQTECGANFNNGNIRSIFSYKDYEAQTPNSVPTVYSQRCTDETQLVPHWNSYIPPKDGFASPTFLGTAINQSYAPDRSMTIYWQVNGSALNVQWETPTLELVRSGNTNWPPRSNLVETPIEKIWTYWVIQQTRGNPPVDVPHPLHLHGHDFFILGNGTGQWDPSFSANLNYNNPPRRDTAMLPSGGWLVLAWQTDNPGAWLFHCHIAWHADEGFGVQFLEAANQIQSVDPIGDAFDKQCQAWKDYYPAKAAYLKADSGV